MSRLDEMWNEMEKALQAKDQEIERLQAQVRVLVEGLESLKEKLNDRKKEGLPYGIPAAAKSREHYKERWTGFNSGLMVAIETMEQALQKVKE
jgi:hypothetical protein